MEKRTPPTTASATDPAPPVGLTKRELVAAAEDVIFKAKFPMLATVAQGLPRLRPISPLKVEDFIVYFANLRRYGKTTELAENPNVELCYLDDRHYQVRITGLVEEITDPTARAELWDASPLLRKYLGSLSNPELILYKIQPSRVRFMKEWALDYDEVPLD